MIVCDCLYADWSCLQCKSLRFYPFLIACKPSWAESNYISERFLLTGHFSNANITSLTCVVSAADKWMETDDNADVVNVLVTTGQLVPTLGKLLLFKLDGAFKATCEPPLQ